MAQRLLSVLDGPVPPAPPPPSLSEEAIAAAAATSAEVGVRWLDVARPRGGGRFSIPSEGITYKRGETLACISEPVLRRFHQKLLRFWRQCEFEKHVYAFRSDAEARVSEAKYAKMGFPGACCSADGVAIPYPRCPAGETGLHKGKEGFCTRRLIVVTLPSFFFPIFPSLFSLPCRYLLFFPFYFPCFFLGPPQAHRLAAGAPREGKGVRGLPGITRYSLMCESAYL